MFIHLLLADSLRVPDTITSSCRCGSEGKIACPFSMTVVFFVLVMFRHGFLLNLSCPPHSTMIMIIYVLDYCYVQTWILTQFIISTNHNNDRISFGLLRTDNITWFEFLLFHDIMGFQDMISVNILLGMVC